MSQATKRRALRRAQWAKRAREYNRFIFGTWDRPSIFDRVDYTATPGATNPYKNKAELATLVELRNRAAEDSYRGMFAKAMDESSIWSLVESKGIR